MNRRPLTLTASRPDTSKDLAGGFVSGGLTIEADDKGERRVLAGLAVPFGEVGFTSWGPTRFEPGSLSDASGIPAVRAHDDDRLLGLVSASAVDDTGVTAKVKVSRISAGDEVLVLAEDGALTGFSGQWKPTKYSFEADDTYGEIVVIEAADWVHLSVVTSPAFDSARITQVAASRGGSNPQSKESNVTLKQLLALLQAADASKRGELLAEHADLIKSLGVTIADVRAMLDESMTSELVELEGPSISDAVEAMKNLGEQIAAGITKLGERPVDLPLAGANGEPHKFVNAGDYAMHAARAQRHDAASEALITAALTTTATGDNVGIVPPNYSAELLGNLPVATPVLNSLVRRTPLPSTGMSIIKPEWDDLPIVATVATQNTQAPTGAVGIDPKTVSVLIAAHAARASISLIERSDFGGFAQNYYEACGISYLSWLEAKALDTMLAAAQAVTATGTTAVAQIMSVIGQVVENQKDGNDNLRGYVPDYVGVGWDVYGELADTLGPRFAGGSVNAGTLNGNLAGIQVYMLPGLAANDILVGARAATTVQAEDAMQLRSMIVETLSIELGVIAHAAFDVEYPLALGFAAGGS